MAKKVLKKSSTIDVAQVKDLYRNPKYPGSFGGVNKFLIALQNDKHKIPLKTLRHWLEEDDLYQLHKPSRKTFTRRPFIVQGIDHLWQVDLSDVTSLKKFNKGYRFILFVIDAFSKYAWVKPLKNKTGPVLARAMEEILKKSKRRPLHVQSDKGGEFTNRWFREVLKKRHINFYTSQNEETKAAFVERLQRTYKAKMFRYFTYKRTLKYLDVLEDLMESYNNTVHSTIGMKPSEVSRKNEALVRRRLSKRWSKVKGKVTDLQKGDQVRLSEKRYPFGKGYLPQWSQEIFQIQKVLHTTPPTFKVEDNNGEVLIGTFYRAELQKVPKIKDRSYYIEKVLKTRKRGKQKQFYVKWEGYPKEFNSWVWEKDMV